LIFVEVQMYEALGFAEYGKGVDLVKGGHTEVSGKIPVNTGGGLIAFGHPVGATGNS
jgi:acetyl-CoA acetyltransferase